MNNFTLTPRDISLDENRMVKERDDFREWLISKGMADNTISSRVSNIKRLQEIFGSLTYLFEKNLLDQVIEILKEARLNESEFNKKVENVEDFSIEATGNYYNVISTLLSALRLFFKFLKETQPSIISDPTTLSFQVNVANIENALESFKYDPEKHEYSSKEVKDLIQEPLRVHLAKNLLNWEWTLEERLIGLGKEFEKIQHRVDVYGINKEDDFICIIEIDTHRSDQITKKFVSRIANSLDKKLIYGVVLYPNQHKVAEAEKKEALKYNKWVDALIDALSTNKCPKTAVHKTYFKNSII